MKKAEIITLLQDYPKEQVEKYASYCLRLSLEKNKKTGQLKNPWIQNKTEGQLADYFRRVAEEGLVFDGEHITLQSTGISFDYIAYKNKMYLAYPEAQVDVSLVYKGDDFAFSKESGKVKYSHNVIDPFGQKDNEVIGGYCVIKNRRGEFLTLLNADDIQKHRKVAKTDYIWREWFKEMALKTVIKKAVKQHFADIYQAMEQEDNENYDLENPLNIDIKLKQQIEEIKTIEELREFYTKNKGKGKEYDAIIINKSKLLTETK